MPVRQPAPDTDVVVVGAGPVGLLLACELRLGGVDVVVVEKLAGRCGESRATHLHARTMEVLDQRGLLDRIPSPPDDGGGHFGGVPLDIRSVPSVHAGLWNVPQPRIEELLEGWALSLGARILRGHEVRDLSQGPDGVLARIAGPAGPGTVFGHYLVGCDGGDSTVRPLAGIPFVGTDADRELLRADVVGIDIRDRRLERSAGGLASAARRPDGSTRVMVHEFGRTVRQRSGPPAFAEVAAGWVRVTGEDISAGNATWVDSFDNASRQATRYRAGRVLLAGDAAHSQLPAGGQAINLGLQDAMNLGWKLAATLRGRAPATLLDSYHAERHPVGARVLTLVAAQALLLFGGVETDGLRGVLAEVLALPAAGRHLAGLLSGVSTRYPTDSAHPLCGARIPHVALGSTSTTHLLHGGQPVLIDLAPGRRGDRTGWSKLADRWPGRLRWFAAEPPADSALAGLVAVLVRPDGHVAWLSTTAAGDSAEEHGRLDAALRRCLGEPTPASSAHQTPSHTTITGGTPWHV